VLVLAVPVTPHAARRSPRLGWWLALAVSIPLLVMLTGFALAALTLLGWLPW